MTLEEILERVESYGTRLVEITGGEPLLQAEVVPLMERLLAQGFEVLLETGGSLPIDGVPRGVKRIVDVKCPRSGESESNRWQNMDQLRKGDELKFVVADRDDYRWAAEQITSRDLASRATVLLSPVSGDLESGEMARWVLEDGLPVRVQIQMHKVLWPGVEQGI